MSLRDARLLAIGSAALLLAACAGTPQRARSPGPIDEKTPVATADATAASSDAAAATAATSGSSAGPATPSSPAPAEPTGPALPDNGAAASTDTAQPPPGETNPVAEELPAAVAEATGADVFARLRGRLQAPVCTESPRAHEWQQRYARHPTVFARKLGEVLPMVDFVAEEVERSGLPAQFAFIPLVESWYEPGAQGRGGPSGMWQMIGSTARNHGIHIGRGYDGRLSPVESTRAALSYLHTLSQMFDGDWQATVMAYNAGEYRLAGAMRRSGSRRASAAEGVPRGLSPITYDYVAKLQALSCLVAEPQRANLVLPESTRFARLAPVLVEPKAATLGQVAERAGVPAPWLRELNPAYRDGRLVAGVPRLVLMPVAAGVALAAAAPATTDAPPLLAEADAARVVGEDDAADEAAPSGEAGAASTHRVRSGDTLSRIAHHYGIPLDALRRFNRLGSSNRIQPGQVLKLVP
jgi:membrane-bound lytic murein transglycosylase D